MRPFSSVHYHRECHGPSLLLPFIFVLTPKPHFAALDNLRGLNAFMGILYQLFEGSSWGPFHSPS